jgi:hypothetical protein
MFVTPTWSDSGESRHRIDATHVDSFESQDAVWTEDEWGSGEVLFARKFSDDDLTLVERIDKMIERKECGHAATRPPETFCAS